MLTQHPTLLIGPSDWHEANAPRAEFDRRIAALWEAHPDAQQAIIFGSAANHAELAYLTNFVPKLEPGVALFTRDSAPKLLFGGGPNMIDAMKPLTYITDMAPLGALAKTIAGWKPLLVGAQHMSSAFRRSIDEATNGRTQDAGANVRSMMQRKSPSELASIRDACGILREVMAAIRASVGVGDSAATSVLAGERAALALGAQDVRTLFSLDRGRTLRPFEALDDRQVDPLQVYAAIRRFNYWAEGFVCISKESRPTTARARLLLDNALAAIGPRTDATQLAKILAIEAPYHVHPVIQDANVAPIGLSLDQPMDFGFKPGGVYSVRVGLTDGGEQHAIGSAMIAVHDDGREVLWRSAIA